MPSSGTKPLAIQVIQTLLSESYLRIVGCSVVPTREQTARLRRYASGVPSKASAGVCATADGFRIYGIVESKLTTPVLLPLRFFQ